MSKKAIIMIEGRDKLCEDMALVHKMIAKRYENVELWVSGNHEKIFEDFVKNQDLIDILVIDHHIQKGICLLEKIFSIKPDLQTIILSGSPYCSEPLGCGVCQQRYNKKRILKPLDKKLFLKALEDFESVKCQYVNRCDIPQQNNFLF